MSRLGAIRRHSICVDEQRYNTDGTMQFVVQTNEGVAAR